MIFLRALFQNTTMKNYLLIFTLLINLSAFSQRNPRYDYKVTDSLLALLQNTKEDTIRLKYYYQLTEEYIHARDHVKTEEYIRKLSILSKKLNYKKGIYMAQLQMSVTSTRLYKYADAAKYADSAADGLKKINNVRQFLYAEFLAADAYNNLNQKDYAISRLENALKYGEISPDTFAKARIYSQLSNLYRDKNNFSISLQYLKKALESFNKVNHTYGINHTYDNMALIYMSQKNWKDAKTYALLYLKGFDDQQFFSPTNYINTLSRLGTIEMRLGNHEAAESYLRKSLNYIRQNKMNVKTTIAHMIFAEIYLLRNLPEKGIEAANIALRDKTLDAASKSELYNILRKCYIALNDKTNEKIYSDKLKNVRGTLENDPYSTNAVNKDLASASYNAGNYKEAYDYYKKYADAENEKLLIEKKERIDELQTTYKLTDKNIQLKNLTIRNQKNEIALARQENNLILSIGILTLIFMGSLFLYWRYRLNKKNNRLLQDKNNEIETSLHEKNLLLKEIHHRVKNNLQLIISLLNIQARENDHIAVNDFLEKGRGRIISMALIHQNLYETDNLAKVDYQEYLQNLITSNAEAYGNDRERIAFSIKAEQIYFDVQTSIPLGLIINELICNAMKHAFGKDDEGLIEINITKDTSGSYVLFFADNGIGFMKENETKTFGTSLVQLLAMQLKGQVVVDSTRGTSYTISFEDLAA